MFTTKGVQVQIGGEDQYGNITAGVHAIKWMCKDNNDPTLTWTKKDELRTRVMGFTVPLLTSSSGEKFGKSEGNAVWLDGDMTSPFDLYQVTLRAIDKVFC